MAGVLVCVGLLYEAEAFGFPQEAAEAVGYKKELEQAIKGLREMHKRPAARRRRPARLLQDREKINYIMKDGRFHKDSSHKGKRG